MCASTIIKNFKNMDLKPIADNIIVIPEKKEEETKSGIIIPESADKEKPQIGEVVAVGPGKTLEDGKKQEMEVKKGDKVVFSKYSPQEIKIDGNVYYILKESEVLAIVK